MKVRDLLNNMKAKPIPRSFAERLEKELEKELDRDIEIIDRDEYERAKVEAMLREIL